jgi:predicted dehydrogenase
MSEPVRVAVLGYGYWGPNIVRTLLDMPEAELAVCCDTRLARLDAARDHFGIAVTSDWEDVLRDPHIEAVILATPARSHRDLTVALVAHDKHVLVEKPFATSSADAEEMLEAAARRHTVLEAGHLFLYHPAVDALRCEVRSGRLGELRTAFAVRCSHGPRARSDVDVTLDCMVHDLYILHELLGPAQEVSATGAAFLTPTIAGTASASVAYASGVRAVCYASWCEPVKTRRMTLAGAKAMADYDDLRDEAPLRILEAGYEPIEGIDEFGNEGLRRFDRGERRPPIAPAEPLRRELEAFVARIRGADAASRVSAESLIAVSRTLEAIGRSLRRGGAPEPVEGAA